MLVPVLLVGGEHPIFEQERHVSEAVLCRAAIDDVGRNPQDQLRPGGGDEFQALAAAVIGQAGLIRLLAPGKVIANLLLQPRGHGHEWGYLMGLFGLRLGSAALPASCEALILADASSGGEHLKE